MNVTSEIAFAFFLTLKLAPEIRGRIRPCGLIWVKTDFFVGWVTMTKVKEKIEVKKIQNEKSNKNKKNQIIEKSRETWV